MKKSLSIFVLTLCFQFYVHSAYAQGAFVFKEATHAYGKETYNSLVTTVDGGNIAEETFEDFMKETYKMKAKRDEKGVLIVHKVLFPEISANKRGDVYFFFEKDDANNDKLYEMSIAFAFGYDIIVNTKDYPEEIKKLQEVFRKYLIYHHQKHFGNQIKDLEKVIKEHNRNIEKNKSKIKSLQKDNESLSKKVGKAKNAADKLKYEQEKVNNDAEMKRLADSDDLIDKQIQGVNTEINNIKSKITNLK